jgi:hypothetical protein
MKTQWGINTKYAHVHLKRLIYGHQVLSISFVVWPLNVNKINQVLELLFT